MSHTGIYEKITTIFPRRDALLILPLHPNGIELAGYIPQFLNHEDKRNAKDQITANYLHGGGWQKFDGFEFDTQSGTLKFPGDPPYRPVLAMMLRDELILIYPYAWVNIVQKDGTWEVARID